MNSIVSSASLASASAIATPANLVPDPILAAIERYWSLLDAKIKAEKRVERLRKRLPEDVTRIPRVFKGNLLGFSGQPDKPLYLHSEYQIDEEIKKRKRTFHGIPPYFGKDGEKRLVDDLAKLRTKWIDGLKADKDRLLEQQEKAGWAQAQTQMWEADRAFYNARNRVCCKTPVTTKHGVVAALRFIKRAQDYETRSKRDNVAPGDTYSASLAGLCAAALERM